MESAAPPGVVSTGPTRSRVSLGELPARQHATSGLIAARPADTVVRAFRVLGQQSRKALACLTVAEARDPDGRQPLLSQRDQRVCVELIHSEDIPGH